MILVFDFDCFCTEWNSYENGLQRDGRINSASHFAVDFHMLEMKGPAGVYLFSAEISDDISNETYKLDCAHTSLCKLKND